MTDLAVESSPLRNRAIRNGVISVTRSAPSLHHTLSTPLAHEMATGNVPIIDLALAKDPSTKPILLAELRHALINIGFLYIKNYDIPDPIFTDLETQSNLFFDLPTDEKLKCEMVHSPHFLGYTKLANEITSLKVDWREQLDFGTEAPAPSPEDPLYKNLVGPNLWPNPEVLPDFRPTVETYLKTMTVFSREFTILVTEALKLPSDTFDKYFPRKDGQEMKMKIIKYPDTADLEDYSSHNHLTSNIDKNINPNSGQGCGPHRDSGFLTYIHQVTKHNSLEVQNYQGNWLKVPPIPNTLVVNVGLTLEGLTNGVCTATIHRVLTPSPGEGARISLPFFQGIDINSHRSQLDIPEDILELKRERDRTINRSDIGFQYKVEGDKPVGYYSFKNRIKSHQDVAEKWYPDVLKQVLSEIGA